MSSPTDSELMDALRLAEGDERGDASADGAASNGHITWEYKAILGGAGSKEAAERLNSVGQEGWELVGVEAPQPGGQTVLYLKRPAQS